MGSQIIGRKPQPRGPKAAYRAKPRSSGQKANSTSSRPNVRNAEESSSEARLLYRLSINMSAETNEKITRLAREIGGTKSDVFRRAIALLEAAVKARKEGKRVGFASPHGKLETEIVGL